MNNERPVDRAAWLARSLWIGLFVAFCVKSWLNPDSHSLFPLFHQVGEAWLEGRSIYYEADPEQEFWYSPLLAVLFAPLAPLPRAIGAMLWNGLSLGLLFVSLRRFFLSVVKSILPQASEHAFLSLACFVALQGGWSAQSNSLVLAFVLFGISELSQLRVSSACLLLSIPIHIKLWPATLIGLFTPKFGWRIVLGAALAFGFLAAIPLATARPDQVAKSYREWIEKVAHREAENSRYGGYRDSVTIFEHTIGVPPRYVYKILQAITGLGILAWVWRNHASGISQTRWLMSNLNWWVAWQLLFGPGTERLTYGIAAASASYVVLESFATGRARGLGVTLWLFLGVLGTGEVERAVLKLWSGAPMLTPLAVIALAVWQAMSDQWAARCVGEFPTAPVVAQTGQSHAALEKQGIRTSPRKAA